MSSAGRAPAGCAKARRPSPSNQARAVIETLALAQHDKFRLNVIEAFDQPWKRALEGAVGGYWGIFDRAAGGPKFPLAGTVSDHPHWAAQALAGVIVAALAFAGAFWPDEKTSFPPMLWPRIAVLALPPAILFGWTLEMAFHRQLQRRQLASVRSLSLLLPRRRRPSARRHAVPGGRCQALPHFCIAPVSAAMRLIGCLAER